MAGRAAGGHHDDRHVPQARDAPGSKIGERRVTINGFAKGSGMIAPDMATMLASFTDAKGAGAGAAEAVADAADDLR